MAKHWTGNRRAQWHDYSTRKIYHITLMKHEDVMNFGSLSGDWRVKPGSPGSSYIAASPLGKIIKECLRDISSIHPALKIYQYALMPDHLHLIISVESPLDETLGHKIACFKVLVNNKAGMEQVFAKGFNDQILTRERDLNTIYTYLRENPYRLAVRFANPDYFKRVNQITIGDKSYSAYGNFQLLSNPFKEQVVIHRAEDGETKLTNHEIRLHCAANGGVLVSPFISKDEKMTRSEAESLGGRIILITHEAFSDRYKPSAHDFDLCCQGRLLIISLGLKPGSPLSREQCLSMNSLAKTICAIK